jgi:hypothetical protein
MSISHITQIEKPEKAVVSTILTRYTARRGNSSLCMPFYLAESGEKK